MRLQDIARHVGGTLEGDGDVEIAGVSSLEQPAPGTITFLADRRLASRVATAGAAAILLGRDAASVDLPTVRVDDPYVAFVDVVLLFHPESRPTPGIHPTAVIAPSARLGRDAAIGPHVVVGEDVVVGDDCVLGPGVVLSANVQAGVRFVAHARVVVREGVRIGDRVTLHAGAVIGSDGFGYLPGPTGIRKIPQVGTVVLEDDVEVGANATIDRAALGVTRIGRGTKIDNLVMVAHGCDIGPYCLLAAQVGLAGGTTLGSGVMLGGQVGSAGHLTVGSGARVAAKSGIHNDLAAGGTYGGYPAIDIGDWRRAVRSFAQLPAIVRRLRQVERRTADEGTEDGA